VEINNGLHALLLSQSGSSGDDVAMIISYSVSFCTQHYL